MQMEWMFYFKISITEDFWSKCGKPRRIIVLSDDLQAEEHTLGLSECETEVPLPSAHGQCLFIHVQFHTEVLIIVKVVN
jgi:hypothetical protein